MRRDELISSVQRIITDLEQSGIAMMFRSAMDSLRRPNAEKSDRAQWIDFAVVTEFLTRYASYTDEEKKILNIFDLSDITNPMIWQQFFSTEDPTFLYTNNAAINNITRLLPQVLSLLKQEDYEDEISIAGAVREIETQKIILTDEKDLLSSPDRLINLLTSVRDIYSIIARLENEPEDSLAVVRLDSGSEKSFDFLGVAKVVSQLREILNTAYVMVAHHRQNVTLKNLEVASESLGVVQKISKMEKDGDLSAEEAARLKHTLFGALQKFSETGAYTPEMDAGHVKPELAMRPLPKLLTGPDGANKGDFRHVAGVDEDIEWEDDHSSSESPAEFSEDELRAAVEALRAARQDRSGAKSKRAPRKRPNRSEGTKKGKGGSS